MITTFVILGVTIMLFVWGRPPGWSGPVRIDWKNLLAADILMTEFEPICWPSDHGRQLQEGEVGV